MGILLFFVMHRMGVFSAIHLWSRVYSPDLLGSSPRLPVECERELRSRLPPGCVRMPAKQRKGALGSLCPLTPSELPRLPSIQSLRN